MARGWERIQSLVIFNEITPEYSLSDDIECRFYVEPTLETSCDKIGLYRIGWTHKQDFIVIKDVHNCVADEFDERRLVFPVNELPKDVLKEGLEYQFCYWHPFGHKQTYQLCGRSETFRFFTPIIKSPINATETHRNASPSAPELSIRYPILDMESLDINKTNPKRLYDLNDRQFDEFLQNEDNIYGNDLKSTEERVDTQYAELIWQTQQTSTPKERRKSVGYELEVKNQELTELREKFAEQNRIKDMEIEKLRTAVRLADKKVTSLEYELQSKVENEDKFEGIHNQLMDTIKVTEAKNRSLEEQLTIRDNDVKRWKRLVLHILDENLKHLN